MLYINLSRCLNYFSTSYPPYHHDCLNFASKNYEGFHLFKVFINEKEIAYRKLHTPLLLSLRMGQSTRKIPDAHKRRKIYLFNFSGFEPKQVHIITILLLLWEHLSVKINRKRYLDESNGVSQNLHTKPPKWGQNSVLYPWLFFAVHVSAEVSFSLPPPLPRCVQWDLLLGNCIRLQP